MADKQRQRGMERALMIPVKEFANAKYRLASFLTPQERRELVWLMLRGVMEAAQKLPHDLRRVIVTSYAPAIELAAELGLAVLSETRQCSESESVDKASAELEGQGVAGILRVPLDLPLITSSHLAEILDLAETGVAAIAVPSLDGTGTNALYRSPPTLFPSRFGPHSLAKHKAQAGALGLEMLVRELPSLALDIDTPEDIGALLETGEKCPARDYLIQIGVEDRLAEAGIGGEGGGEAP